jgi:hypothetical protein
LLFDGLGKIIYQTNLSIVNEGEKITVPLGNISQGVYFLKIISDKGSKTQKVIVTR